MREIILDDPQTLGDAFDLAKFYEERWLNPYSDTPKPILDSDLISSREANHYQHSYLTISKAESLESTIQIQKFNINSTVSNSNQAKMPQLSTSIPDSTSTAQFQQQQQNSSKNSREKEEDEVKKLVEGSDRMQSRGDRRRSSDAENETVNNYGGCVQSSAEDGASAEEMRTPVATTFDGYAAAQNSTMMATGSGASNGAEDDATATGRQGETAAFIEGAAAASGGGFLAQTLCRIVSPIVAKPPPLLAAVLPCDHVEARTVKKQEEIAFSGAGVAGRSGCGAPLTDDGVEDVVELVDEAHAVNGLSLRSAFAVGLERERKVFLR
ncbi:hypothetical protein PIB30_022662 [Stylosanthes scabra]|uniref:Uncharacterized protein n=1 Tax=Stylosanthes scabra TaxID=79078 RepID=A0ABU6VCB2_9FABA|nr:hypothetical protein [Stylosanthes scabra]